MPKPPLQDSKKLRKLFRRYCRGGRYKIGARYVAAFFDLGWLEQKLESTGVCSVATVRYVTEKGQAVLKEKVPAAQL